MSERCESEVKWGRTKKRGKRGGGKEGAKVLGGRVFVSVGVDESFFVGVGVGVGVMVGWVELGWLVGWLVGWQGKEERAKMSTKRRDEKRKRREREEREESE